MGRQISGVARDRSLPSTPSEEHHHIELTGPGDDDKREKVMARSEQSDEISISPTLWCAYSDEARPRFRNEAPIPKDQGFVLSSRGNRLSATGLQNGFAEVRKLADFDGGKPFKAARSPVCRDPPQPLAPTARRRSGAGHISRPRQLHRHGLLPERAALDGGAARANTAHLLVAPLLESYFRQRLTKQRNATPATVASYRDALRMLILLPPPGCGRSRRR
ncbi:hypothetical protein NKH84_31710 [Mesorhizobium sp. M0902]|uniref:hypothetical protein n=1 Tax=unclassified Mesorhizobium TaxID=325217 RepID=UPI00333AD5EF